MCVCVCVCACVAPVRHTDWSEPQKEVTAVRCMQRNARHKHLHALSTLQRTQRAFHQRTRGRSTRGEKAARLTHRTQHGALGWAGLAGLARLRLGLISCTYARYGLRARASPGSAPATWNTCLVPSSLSGTCGHFARLASVGPRRSQGRSSTQELPRRLPALITGSRGGRSGSSFPRRTAKCC